MPLLRSSCVALTEFATDLTVLVPSDAKYAPRARAVLSSGGVADGVVVSEGMGYGLLLAGVALASEPRVEQLFLTKKQGWDARKFDQELYRAQAVAQLENFQIMSDEGGGEDAGLYINSIAPHQIT